MKATVLRHVEDGTIDLGDREMKELVFEVEDSKIKHAKEIIKDTMENVIELKVPLTIDLGIGKNWDEAH